MAIEATKYGAYDYFPNPEAGDFEESGSTCPWVTELSDMVKAAASNHRLTAKVTLTDDTAFVSTDPIEDRMVGKSRRMQDVFKAIGRAAATDLTVHAFA
jgi:DNA-binding NtrC family response regulator